MTRAVALLAARDQFFTLLAPELCQPVAVFTGARSISILRHEWERIISNITLAVSLLDAADLLLDNLQKVAFALCALVA